MSEAEESPLDLTGLDFGPSWAKDKTPARDYSKEVGPRDNRDRRGKGPRRDGGKSQGDRRNNNRRDQGGDRRNNDRRNNDRRNNDRRNQNHEPRQETPAPKGFVGGVMPVEEGLDNLSKEIQGGGRTYSVFDLARVVMGARERFNVTFEAAKGSKIFRCKSDGSLWLTKDEAVRHFWQADLLDELYEILETEVDAPKGNFTSVAKCGLSGQWLAPPNYHSYPATIAQMHAERFSHMSLEDYKRKIRVESGEEVVQAWLDTQTKKQQFRPFSSEEIIALRKARQEAAQKKTEEPANENSAPQAEAATEEPPQDAKAEQAEEPQPEKTPAPAAEEETPAPEANDTPAEETPAAEAPAEPEGTEATEATEAAPEESNEEPKEEAPAEETPANDNLLDTRRDVERHFAEHHFKQIYAQVERAYVPGNVSAKLLSPGLLTLLKATVADERRYPSKLTPILCRQLSGRHLAVFKWKKKLKAGPARPHAVPDDLALAERPKAMLAWITDNSGKTLEDLWKSNLPADADKETKQNFYHDFHWLLNQGFVLLLADSTVHLAKAKTPEPPKKEKQEENPKAEEPKTEEPKAEEAKEPSKVEEPEAEAPQEEVKAEEPKAKEPDAPKAE